MLRLLKKKKPKKETGGEKTEQKEKIIHAPQSGAGLAFSGRVRKPGVIVKPWLSEKARDVNALNQYVFAVRSSATKNEVKREVEERYRVRVTAVRTVRKKGKSKRWRNKPGKGVTLKKAIVTLASGQTIEIFPH